MSHNPLSLNTLGFLGGVLGLATIGYLSDQAIASTAEQTVDRPTSEQVDRAEGKNLERVSAVVGERDNTLEQNRVGSQATDRPTSKQPTRRSGNTGSRPRSGSSGVR